MTHRYISHRSVLITVCSYDDVDILNDTSEGLVDVLFVHLKLKQSSIHLVQEQHWLDALCDGLSQDCLGLGTYTCG